MSQKMIKRKAKRDAEDSDGEFKLPTYYAKEPVTNSHDNGIKTRQSSASNTDSDTDDSLLACSDETNSKSDSPKPNRSRSTTPKINKAKEAENDAELGTNGTEVQQESGTNGEELLKSEEAQLGEIEPLILEVEDPELMFEEGGSESDIDASDKGSPVLSRSVTRRSHTRNIPTPKTPKSAHENGTETEQPVVDMNPSIVMERLPNFITQTEPSTDEQSSQEQSEPTFPVAETNGDAAEETTESIEPEVANSPDLTIDSCMSASEYNSESLLVNLTGDDATRNIDFSCADDSVTSPPYLSKSKSQSLAESYRSLSSRRSIRPVAEDIYRRRAFQNAQDDDRFSTERINMKRKRSTTPDGPKRYKLQHVTDQSPSAGFLSYLSSPIQNIRNRFSRFELSSSTPKLMGYKTNAQRPAEELQNEDVDVGHVVVEGVAPASPSSEKKWCVVM